MKPAKPGDVNCRSTCWRLGILVLALTLPLVGANSGWAQPRSASVGAQQKFDRVNHFAATGYAPMQREVARRMRGVMQKSRSGQPATLTKDEAVAVMVMTMMRTTMRPGNEASTHTPLVRDDATHRVQQRPSFGASTLRHGHVKREGNGVRLRFWGKSKVRWERDLHSPALARAVSLLKEQPGTRVFNGDAQKRLFQVPGARGQMIKVTDGDLRGFFARYGAKSKDLRTLQAKVLLLRGLSARPQPRTTSEAESTLESVIGDVARQMGHTHSSTTVNNYLEPQLLESYRKGQLDARQQWSTLRGLLRD